MAEINSTAAVVAVPAKSGVRDVFRVPFTVAGTLAAAAGDNLNLVKVASGHRIVGYYLESITNMDSGAALRSKLTYSFKNSAGSVTTYDLVKDSSFGSSLSGANTSNAAGSISHTGARTSAGAIPATAPGTFVGGTLPSPAFDNEGTVVLTTTTAATTPQAFSLAGYVEIQPV